MDNTSPLTLAFDMGFHLLAKVNAGSVWPHGAEAESSLANTCREYPSRMIDTMHLPICNKAPLSFGEHVHDETDVDGCVMGWCVHCTGGHKVLESGHCPGGIVAGELSGCTHGHKTDYTT